jgi:hypothetical protein
MGCGLDGRGSIPGRGKKFFRTSQLHTGSGAHAVSYTVGAGVSFIGGKAARA